MGDLARGVGMLVPETAMNKYDFLAARKHQVRAARQVMPVQPVTVAHTVDQAANGEFRLHALAPNRPHRPAANLGGYAVHDAGPRD